MSIIAVQIKENLITIGADSQDTLENIQETNRNEKLFKIDDDFYIGMAGNAHIGSLLRAFAENNRPSNDRMELHNYFDSFAEWANELLPPINSDCGHPVENHLGSLHLLIVIDGKVYKFYNHFLTEVKEFTAIGCGASVALGMLMSGSSVEDAIKTTCKVDIFCSEPVDIYTIDTTEDPAEEAFGLLSDVLQSDNGPLAIQIVEAFKNLRVKNNGN